MRRLLLVPCALVMCTSSVFSSSFVTPNITTQSQSTLVLEAKTSSFDLYGPTGPNCKGADCPTMADLEKIAKRGVNVLKISGGDVSQLDNVFPIAPKKDMASNTEMKPDNYKTGPLPDGEKQQASMGVETELMPDMTPEFEPEFAIELRTIDSEEDVELRVNASDESIATLINAL